LIIRRFLCRVRARLPIRSPVLLALVVLASALRGHAETLRAGIDPAAPPLTYVDPSGHATGFAVELARAVAKDQGFQLEFDTSPWPTILAGVRAGRVDLLPNVSYTPERDTFLEFAVADLDLRIGVFYRRDGPAVHNLEELAGLRLAVSNHSRAHDYLLQQHWGREIIATDSVKDAIAALANDECDAVIATALIARQVVRENAYGDIVDSELELPGISHELHMAVPVGRTALLYRINNGLAHLRANGTYDRLYKQWIGELEPRHLRFEDVQPYLPLAMFLACAIGAALLWQRRVLRQLARQAETLRENQERLTLVLEGSEDGFWDWNLVTGRIDRSERWASMIGYSIAEIAMTIDGGRSLVHPDDLPAYDALQQRLNRADTDRYDIEYRMRTKSGGWRWIHDRGKVVSRGPDGAPLRMAGTHTDITQRKSTESALFESQALLKRSANLLEQTQAATHIGGWELDLRTGRMYWSREAYRIHDTSPDVFQPTREAMLQFCSTESRAALAAALERAEHGEAYALELELRTAQGRPIRVHATGTAEMADDRVTKIYGSFRDITLEHAAEQEREKLGRKMLDAQKLESLGVLAGGIAHDFNNLLTVILANASFARFDGHENDERLANIEVAARRAADLCRQMLAYAGKGSFIVQRIDLGELVHDTTQLLQVSISKKARLKLALVPALPPVHGDVSQLRQLVMNLVINASEAIGDANGEIRIATRRARPEAPASGAIHSFDVPAGECVCLEVADTGHGMNPDTLARIFDPFFTTKFAGRGLGLAAVLGIVRAHHGALTVQSEPGRGSTFRLYLPASPQAEAGRAAATVVSPAARVATVKGAAILVADDEDGVLNAVDSVLRHAGYRTVLTRNGEEAVARFRATPNAFAAVLFDLTMPGLDGVEVLRAVRALNTATPALVMSGFSEQDVFERLRGLGEVAIVRKPFTREALVAQIAAAIARHQTGPAAS
jgi:two-component system, cell cycle sensor histidine kinase and response regulator CckA